MTYGGTSMKILDFFNSRSYIFLEVRSICKKNIEYLKILKIYLSFDVH